MEFKVSKEQILEAHRAACSDWKQKIESWFPEAFGHKNYLNKWIRPVGYLESILVYVTGDAHNVCILEPFRGYGFCANGDWFDESDWGTEITEWREASREEVIEAFNKEAVRRHGNKWNRVMLGTSLSVNKRLLERLDLNQGNKATVINPETPSMWNRNGLLFKDGKWEVSISESRAVKQENDELRNQLDKMKSQQVD